jgi:hypothetical protein
MLIQQALVLALELAPKPRRVAQASPRPGQLKRAVPSEAERIPKPAHASFAYPFYHPLWLPFLPGYPLLQSVPS